MAQCIYEVITELTLAFHPDSSCANLESSRIAQLFSNLLGDAITHEDLLIAIWARVNYRPGNFEGAWRTYFC